MMAAGKGACISVPNKPSKQSEMEDGAVVTFTCSSKDRWGHVLVALVWTHSSPYHRWKIQMASSTLLMSNCAFLGCVIWHPWGLCVLSRSWHHHHMQCGMQQLHSARAEPHEHRTTRWRVWLRVGLSHRKILCHSRRLGPSSDCEDTRLHRGAWLFPQDTVLSLQWKLIWLLVGFDSVLTASMWYLSEIFPGLERQTRALAETKGAS